MKAITSVLASLGMGRTSLFGGSQNRAIRSSPDRTSTGSSRRSTSSKGSKRDKDKAERDRERESDKERSPVRCDSSSSSSSSSTPLKTSSEGSALAAVSPAVSPSPAASLAAPSPTNSPMHAERDSPTGFQFVQPVATRAVPSGSAGENPSPRSSRNLSQKHGAHDKSMRRTPERRESPLALYHPHLSASPSNTHTHTGTASFSSPSPRGSPSLSPSPSDSPSPSLTLSPSPRGSPVDASLSLSLIAAAAHALDESPDEGVQSLDADLERKREQRVASGNWKARLDEFTLDNSDGDSSSGVATDDDLSLSSSGDESDSDESLTQQKSAQKVSPTAEDESDDDVDFFVSNVVVAKPAITQPVKPVEPVQPVEVAEIAVERIESEETSDSLCVSSVSFSLSDAGLSPAPTATEIETETEKGSAASESARRQREEEELDEYEDYDAYDCDSDDSHSRSRSYRRAHREPGMSVEISRIDSDDGETLGTGISPQGSPTQNGVFSFSLSPPAVEPAPRTLSPSLSPSPAPPADAHPLELHALSLSTSLSMSTEVAEHSLADLSQFSVDTVAYDLLDKERERDRERDTHAHKESPHKESVAAHAAPPIESASPSPLHAKTLHRHSQDHTHTHAASSAKADVQIPQFFFVGKRNCAFNSKGRESETVAARLPEIRSWYHNNVRGIPMNRFAGVTKRLCGLPSYCNLLLCKRMTDLLHPAQDGAPPVVPSTFGFDRSARKKLKVVVSIKTFLEFWSHEMEPYDKVERLFNLIKQPCNSFIEPADLQPLLSELLYFHPGLKFMEPRTDIQEKYTVSVIARIFYKCNTSRTGRLTLREFRQGDLYSSFMFVDEVRDIDKELNYFSYEHFYVLACTFMTLDVREMRVLRKNELAAYNERAISPAVLDRLFHMGKRAFSDGRHGYSVFSPASPQLPLMLPVKKTERESAAPGEGLEAQHGAQSERDDAAAVEPVPLSPAEDEEESGMCYADFVFFMISEVDKTTAVSLKYWFAVFDLDDDGVISLNDLRFFVHQQAMHIASLVASANKIVPQNMVWQILDLVGLAARPYVLLSDLDDPEMAKKCGTLFDLLSDGTKMLTSFSGSRMDMIEPREWSIFANEEYHRLME